MNLKEIRELLDEMGIRVNPNNLDLISEGCYQFFRMNPTGRALWEDFENDFIFKSSFIVDSQRKTDFQEGMRFMFLYINSLMKDYEERIVKHGRRNSNDDTGEYFPIFDYPTSD